MSDEKLVLQFKTKSFRRIPNPYFMDSNGASKGPEMYVLICDVKDVPDDIPMGTNPREQKLTTNVAKKIKSCLQDTLNKNFYLLNRGILISAESVQYDNKNDVAKVYFSDLNVHGNVDGGHTYRIIKDMKDQLEPGEQYVKIEILAGIEDIFQELAAARNTSVQVQDKSIAELYQKFDIIKKAIANRPYADDVYFKENEPGRIDVSDIIAILNLFNLDRYPNGPRDTALVSYNAKKACIDSYIKYYDTFKETIDNPYVKMSRIIPDIFDLYEHLEMHIGDYYSDAVKNGQYGRTVGVSVKRDGADPFKSKFMNQNIRYATPNGFLYPIMGAFRALIEEGEDGYYRWKKGHPITMLDKIGSELVTSVVDMSRELGNNPNATGKNRTIWQNLYMTVLMAAMS